jgi:hypothetical protein
MQLGVFMKTATIPPLRVDPELRNLAQSSLREGETLSSFVIESLKAGIKNRQLKQAFINRGLTSRDDAKITDEYYGSDDVLGELKQMLDNAV